MFATVFVATLLATCPSTLAMEGPPRRRHSASTLAPRRRPPLAEPAELYSPRARRRIAAYLRMRMLELRIEGLDRAAGVIEGRSPLRTLFEDNDVRTRYMR